MCQFQGVVVSICCAKHASVPFMFTAESKTSITCPFREGTSLGLCAVLLIFFVLPTFNCSPTSAKHVTSSSTKKRSNQKNVLVGESHMQECGHAACHLENPHQHWQPSDASIQALILKHTKTTADSIHIRVAHLSSVKVKVKVCRPGGSAFRAQTKCRNLPDQLVYNVKNTKSCFDRIH